MLHAQAQFIGDARIAGRLYRLGSYPGAVASQIDGEWVRGEVYSMENPRWILPALDHYEGPNFERVSVETQLDSGERIEAWIYVYRGTPSGERIRSGDWFRG